MPIILNKYGAANCAAHMVEIVDPGGTVPDYSVEARTKRADNERILRESDVVFSKDSMALLASEDQMLDLLDGIRSMDGAETLVFDITSFPKRYFCFMLRRVLRTEKHRNVLVTYTCSGASQDKGYPESHLAYAPLPAAPLPGFGSVDGGDTLVVSIGFEALSFEEILAGCSDNKHIGKLICPFPPNGDCIRRVWAALAAIAKNQVENVQKAELQVIAAWDTGQVYRTLRRWKANTGGLKFAPFGPKPHTLGMVLFALRNGGALYYAQPTAYNPDYCIGWGDTWAYVAKWDGVACYDRAEADT